MKKKFAILMTALTGAVSLLLVGCKTNIEWIDEKICDHEYVFVKITLEPTCMEEGERLLECTKCGDEKTETMEKAPHVEKIIPDKAATCAEEGWTVTTCEICQEVLTLEVLPKTDDHVYTDTVNTKAFKGNYLYEECTLCGNVYTPEMLGLDSTRFAYKFKVAGNWYRFYKSTFDELSEEKTKITYKTDSGVSFVFSSPDKYESTFDIAAGGMPVAPETFGVVYFETEEYIDFFVHAGVYKQELDGMEWEAEITSETVLINPDNPESSSTIDLRIIVDNRAD